LEGDVSDPSLGKAIVTITGGSAVNPEAEVTGLDDEAEINIGDLAVMITPSPDARKLRVALSEDLDAEFTSALKAAIADKEEYERGISLVDADDMYEFIVAATGSEEINISDVKGKLRNTVKTGQFAVSGVAKVLSGFSRQKSLRALRGEGGGRLEDNVSLKVSLQPFLKPGARTLCDPAYPAPSVLVNQGQNPFKTPVCSQYKFVVEADAETLFEEIQVGVLYLSSDGNIYSIPGNLRAAQNAQAFRLSPPNRSTGEPGNLRIVLDDVYQALPPPEAEDEVLVFGVTAKTPVPWWSLATNVNSRTRSAITVRSQLHREIASFMFAGTRNGASVGSDEPLSTWTISRIGLQVVADEGALERFAGARGASNVAPDWDDVLCKERVCKTE